MSKEELNKKLNDIEDEEILGIYISDELDKDFYIESYVVHISKKLYLENKELIDEYVRELCKKDRTDYFLQDLFIYSDYHITDEYLELIASNNTIKNIYLETISQDYKLTRRAFEILKKNANLTRIKTRFVSEELENEYDTRLIAVMRREVKKYLTVRDILYNDKLNIVGDFAEQEKLEMIKYLKDRKKSGIVEFSCNNDGKSIKDIIDYLEQKEKDAKEKTKIFIEIEDREGFDYSPFTDIEQNSRIKIITTTDEITDLNTYIKVEEKIKELITPIKEAENDLSPFEKIVWLYTVVSNFRKYTKEEPNESWKDSRLLHKLLFNDKIVCVGYSFLLSNLAQRLNLDIMEAEANFENSKNNNLKFNHFLNLINIKDEKYGIDGLYLLDVTQDNNKQDNYYLLNHLMISPDKYKKYNFDVYVAGFSMLNIDSFDEFESMAKRDNISLISLVQILEKKFKDNELFRTAFSNIDAMNFYYMSNLEKIYELASTYKQKEISIDDILKALTKIEKLKNPNISDEDLKIKLKNSLELFTKREEKIYKEGTLNKHLSEEEQNKIQK